MQNKVRVYIYGHHLKYMSKVITVAAPKQSINTEIKLVSSKSESNRALIINAVADNKCTLYNLSEARDTRTMLRLLTEKSDTLDVLDAGTTMRFLTALTSLGLKEGHKILTGTARMCERPIGILADALVELGANISFMKVAGYPPLEIQPFTGQKTNHIQIRGDVSSQYISALVMSAPLLPQGLELELTGKISSRPYIEMTLSLMSHFGVKTYWKENTIVVEAGQAYTANEYTIESDWSGASYWYSIVALSKDAKIELLGLKENSLQGDSAIVGIAAKMGVKSTFTKSGVLLESIPAEKEIDIDFSHCPDIAQTIAVIAAAKNIKVSMTGLESLRIKETDRITALQNELGKFNATMLETVADTFVIDGSKFQLNKTPIATYDDHRMAMAFAPLAILSDVIIDDPEVVVKSYPSYWNDLKHAGFTITE